MSELKEIEETELELRKQELELRKEELKQQKEQFWALITMALQR